MTLIPSLRKTLLTGLLALVPLMPALAEVSGGVPFTRIYTDEAGESHFEDGEIPLDSVTLQAGEEAGLRQLATGSNATLLMLEPGAFEDWHPAPDPQVLVVIQGVSEVGVTDGEVRQFGPGSVILMEDDTGKGHTTRTVGDENHIGLMIPLEDVEGLR